MSLSLIATFPVGPLGCNCSIVADPETKAALETATGGEVRASTADEMRVLIQSQVAKWTEVIKAANIPRL